MFGLLTDQRILFGATPFMIGSLFMTKAPFDASILLMLVPIAMIFGTILFINNTNVFKRNGFKLLLLFSIT